MNLLSSLPDLDDCASEPIRIPGAIQPHGRMVVLDADGRVCVYSANWRRAEDAAQAVSALDLSRLAPHDAPMALGDVRLDDASYTASGHVRGGLVIVEFEPAWALGAEPPIYSLARHFLPRLQGAADLSRLVVLAVEEMKRLTGFGRCLLYRFDDHGHGEVLAEALDPGYDSYAGHHFPASDIPPQARALYCENHIRLIADANYLPVPLLGIDPEWRADQLDLTGSSLRSVSPVHLEYMRHMGTLSSMSVSIVVRGRLWGLVSCHDHAPRYLGLPVRVACEHLGRLLSLQIEAKEDSADVAVRHELRRLTLAIVSHLADSDASLQRLVEEPAALMNLAGASGAAVVLDEACWSVGSVPDETTIREIATWVTRQDDVVVATDELPREVPAAASSLAVAAGVLGLSISQVHRHVILWFRPEILQTIQWAGDPRKEVGAGQRIHPRRSFASWRETIRGHSLPWSATQLAAVGELRQALIGIVLRRAQELAEAATELGKLNKELEAFSYTVSHDLRAPMRHISGYVDLVLDTEGKQLGERSQRYLSHVKEASQYAGQLVDALLEFSRMGRSALQRRPVDTQVLVADLVRELTRHAGDRQVEWDIDEPLPMLQGDPFLLQVAIRNLLENALKYTRDRAVARIRIEVIRRSGQCGLQVSDNGAGFDMAYVAKLFGVFQRLHHSEEFPGTGIGLASVRRIVERHGGEVWAHGELNRGATFGLTIPEFSQEGD
ncbi:ATP-binding protein [Rhizobacter sp. LjRoot28]|uniref:ATP-binding protein n=1 Tax=Rhizobacter sp. LjRoot28 TaxID=3342309 RepID=UPI003ECDF36F